MGFDVWLENRTPFAAATHGQLDADGQEVLLLMVSASFEMTAPEVPLTVAREQLPVCFADEPYGDPAMSSIRHEADIAQEKPGVEVLVIGQAHAPGGKSCEQVDVALRAGSIGKVLTVTGDRLEGPLGASRPAPFLTMPLMWERAHGGSTPEGAADVRNLVGIGWKDSLSADPQARSEVPNITYVGDDGPNPAPAGFGPVGRGWQPRIGLAGTYDDAWLADQWPLAPHDYDPRHNLCAPADQHVDVLPAGSAIAVMNMTPSGRWSFALPKLRAPVQMIYADRIETVELRPDTVILEPDLMRVTLKGRVVTRLIRNSPKLKEIAYGHVSPVWLNARKKGKAYLNPNGGDGTLTREPVWSL